MSQHHPEVTKKTSASASQNCAPLANRSKAPSKAGAAVCAALVALSLTLTGCDLPLLNGYVVLGNGVNTHRVAFWRQKEDYYARFYHSNGRVDAEEREALLAEGEGPSKFDFNSCMDPAMDIMSVCSGRGHCMPFDRDVANPILFCECNPGWGGPECRTHRKSQAIAWTLSIFLGPLGADEMYLGWPIPAVLKLTVTTCAFCILYLGHSIIAGIVLLLIPWLFDVVRIGSTPVRAFTYHCAADLPRWTFVLVTVTFFSFIALALGLKMISQTVGHRRFEANLVKNYGASSRVMKHYVV